MSSETQNHIPAQQPTPMLNTLLSKSNDGTPTPSFASPQQSPVPNGDRYPASTSGDNGTGPSVSGSGAPLPHPGGAMPHPHQMQQHPQMGGGMPPNMQGHHFPPGYPPHYFQMPGRLPPGYPPQMYPPPGMMPPGQYPPGYPHHMVRQHQMGDMVKMPNGPTPAEWAAAQSRKEGGPEGMDEMKSQMEGGWPPHMQRGPMPPQMPPPAPMPPPRRSIVDQLVGPPTPSNPPRVMPERRAFFERLVAFCEQRGDPITMVPQVSKQNVDLHRLYIAVRNRGGFEQVTKDKAWKSICTEANPEISESSAAGYQLRKHYQRHLLMLECVETGRNADDAIAFADKLKKKRPPKTDAAPANIGAAQTPSAENSQTGPGSTPTAPQTPSQSVPTPTPQTPQQGAPPSQTPGQPLAGYPSGYPPPDANFYPHPEQRGGWPPPHPGYPPPGAFRPMPPGMRPPQALPDGTPLDEQQRQQMMQQQHMHMQQQQQQQHMAASAGPATPAPAPGTPAAPATPCQASTPAAPATPGQPGTPASQSTNMLQVDSAASQGGSRAPSAGPGHGASTPDSSSRLSAGADEQRPPSQALNQNQQPSTSIGPMPPAGASSPFYPTPGAMYPMRPGVSGASPGMRPPGPGGYPPAGYPAPHPGYPPMSSQQYMQQQQQYWQRQQQQQQPGMYLPGPGQPPVVSAPGAAPSQRYYPRLPGQPTSQGAPSPGASRMPSQLAATPRTTAPYQTPSGHPSGARPYPEPAVPTATAPVMPPQMAPPPSFPAGCVEATPVSTRKRKRPSTKDFYGASPRRVLMCLRSGLDTETSWALNALNVQLSDDNGGLPKGTDLQPLLHALTEHIWAPLAVLWPEKFKVATPFNLDCPEVVPSEDEVKGEKVSLPKPVVTPRTSKESNPNYTLVTRTNRKVRFEETEMPIALRKAIAESVPGTSQSSGMDVSDSAPLTGGLSERVAARLRRSLNTSSSHISAEESTSSDSPSSHKIRKEDPEGSLYYRVAAPGECPEGPIDRELEWNIRGAIIEPRPALQNVAQRCLCVSNILRSLSFCVGTEMILSRHKALMYILGRLLTLMVEEVPFKRTNALQQLKDDRPGDDVTEPCVQPSTSATLDKEDETVSILKDTADQLRDDSFTIISHLSGAVELYPLDESISYPLLDGLLHWLTSSIPQAFDTIVNGATTPRNYALEILCKLCVIESNVDLLTCTGSWPRLQRAALVLSRLINMAEETHIREFSLVILNAMCVASPEIAWTTAHETPAFQHLITFIETADQNMHQVMQQHGMPALRDNPELMGTSVGMLRRAAGLLRLLTKTVDAHRRLAKYQQRLLQFTMSQLMDSRVAAMVADTLFEVQSGIARDEKKERKTEEEAEKKRKSETLNNGETETKVPVIKEECDGGESQISTPSPVPSAKSKLKVEDKVEEISSPVSLPNGIRPRENGGSMTAVA